jgi:hypothetical protein
MQLLLVAAAPALVSVLWTLWGLRAQSARRFHSALDAYADLEIGRSRRRLSPRSQHAFSTRVGLK